MIEMCLSYSGIREKGEGFWEDLGEGCTQAGKKKWAVHWDLHSQVRKTTSSLLLLERWPYQTFTMSVHPCILLFLSSGLF